MNFLSFIEPKCMNSYSRIYYFDVISIKPFFLLKGKYCTFDDFLKNYQNEYIESKGKFVDEKYCGIGVKK